MSEMVPYVLTIVDPQSIQASSSHFVARGHISAARAAQFL